ncbi:MAG TPA: LPS export ABC transporter periplasmic protein LptC, partial [Methylophilaceae bacterium]|nr:LPS export ABC transporter periplasmic protein LptC [Methylophilaceae bacterium]
MFNRPIILFPLALLTILALLTFWINRSVHAPVHKAAANSRHDPDYILNNFVTTKTDPNGNVIYKLHAAEMKHFPDDDSTELQQPDLTQYAVGKPDVRITSKRGLVSSNGENVQFMDNVKLVRDAYAGHGEMTLLTQYLNVTPDTGVATTNKPVVIKEAPQTVIHGTGMIYNKKQQTIQLLHNARVHYVRPASASKPRPKA